MTTVKYLTYTTADEAKAAAKKFNNANIRMNGNDYFKFLNVHFDCFTMENLNFFRIGALIYSPHGRYGWLMLTDHVTVAIASDFLTSSFHDFLRTPGNEHFVQQIVADYTLCVKDDDALNLFNIFAVPGAPFVPKQFLLPCNKLETQKVLIKKEKRTSKWKKWKKRIAKNRMLKQKVDELNKYVKQQEGIVESGKSEMMKTIEELKGENGRMKQMIVNHGVVHQNHRDKEMQYDVKLVEANRLIEEKDSVIKLMQGKIEKLEALAVQQSKNMMAYSKKCSETLAQQEKELIESKRTANEKNNELKKAMTEKDSLLHLLKESRETNKQMSKDMAALHAAMAKKTSTTLIQKLDCDVNTLLKENAMLREQIAQLNSANTISFEEQVNWANDGLHLPYGSFYDDN